MTIDNFIKLVQNIVDEANQLKRQFTAYSSPVNYACIFCQDNNEYDLFIKFANSLGEIIQETKMGPVFKTKPIKTIAGKLELLKIRKPDITRPERGDADFTLSNYQKFKQKHLGQPGFSLIDKGNFEMIELVNTKFNVLVYFSHPTLGEVLEIK